jgi:cell division transport system permease protein
MFSRITYTLRETWASFQRNVTLTVAAIITSAISLLIFGLTLLMQQGFDNLLSRWEGGVDMIVNVDSSATPEQLSFIKSELDRQIGVTIQSISYCDAPCSMDDARRVLAGDPSSLELLNEGNIPTQFKIVPVDGSDISSLVQLKASYQGLPKVLEVALPEDEIDIISKLKGFLGLITILLSTFLLFAAVLLIWNTIRTAMYARRREIEVMKLVGATDWFIRLPFMLEGLLQGLIGSLGACGALWLINGWWTDRVQGFPQNSGFSALVVVGNYPSFVMIVLVVIGALAGAIGSGIAASRFLDV